MAAPPHAPAEGIAALRADLTEAGFTVDGVTDLVGPVANSALGRDQRLPADLATRYAGSPLATLVRLFTLGSVVAQAEVERAVPRFGVAALAAAGLAEISGRGWQATCDLRPYGEHDRTWWVASDLAEMTTGRPLAPDHVLGIGGASLTLASWTPRPDVGTALDMGTGSGVQALHLNRHAGTVVATDLSPRALAFAAFTAALNGVDLDLCQGSLFEPVAGQRFSLVVSNPPFVISPRTAGLERYTYRDGGLTGDALVEQIVRTVGQHLEPGGIAQLLANWEVPSGSTWQERVGAWVDGTGLDAWVVQREVQDPAQYAELWVRDAGYLPGTSNFESRYAAWLSDSADRSVQSVGFGVVTLQRPATTRDTWVDLVEHSGPVAAAMGPVVLAGVRARTWLAEHGDAGLLATAWRVAADVTEERHHRPGAEDPSRIVLRQGGGLGLAVPVDTAVAACVGVCDGSLPAGRALDAIAAILERDPAQVRAQALPALRGLVADGMLLR